MKKRNLPTGQNRKRWIDRLSDLDYKNLSNEERSNYLRFQRYSQQRETKIKTLNELKEKIKNLKSEITELDHKEESNFNKIQQLHNQFGCRIEISRQKRTPSSLLRVREHGSRKTNRGQPLKVKYNYHGKIKSVNFSKPKSCYFQTEVNLLKTIGELKGSEVYKKLSDMDNPIDGIRKYLLPDYKNYIIYLLRKNGVKRVEKQTIQFSEFVDWFKNSK